MSHKKLDVWKESIKLTVDIYNLTKNFPDNELYGLINQIRRSAVSIPSNIAEGCARQTSKETIQFLHIGLGSAAELETQVIIANELGYIKNTNKLFEQINFIKKLILGLIKYYKNKKKP